MDFATWGVIYGRAEVVVFENTGNNQYEEVWRDTVCPGNGHDLFSGNDCDQDGKLEFFVGFAHPMISAPRGDEARLDNETFVPNLLQN
jgi:hypothetical protein